jgi:hypothetical protein
MKFYNPPPTPVGCKIGMGQNYMGDKIRWAKLGGAKLGGDAKFCVPTRPIIFFRLFYRPFLPERFCRHLSIVWIPPGTGL